MALIHYDRYGELRIIFYGKKEVTMNRTYHILILCLIGLSSCTTVKSLKYGSPSTDTFYNFTVDTIFTNNAIKDVIISSTNHDKFFEESKFSGGGFNSETIGEYFSRVRGDGALLIVRNDTILLEQYYGNFSKHLHRTYSPYQKR